jgi:hypothetical protein
MYAIELQTRVKDGKIEIPAQYQDKLKETVRVIILAEDQDTTSNLIDQLLVSPLKIKSFKPLSRTDIYERD